MVNEMDDTKDTFDMCMAGFILSNTLSENGPVTRGVCTVDDHGYLSKVTETYDVYKAGDGMHAADHDGNPVTVTEGQHVSMNMFGLPASFVRTGKRFPEIPLRCKRRRSEGGVSSSGSDRRVHPQWKRNCPCA